MKQVYKGTTLINDVFIGSNRLGNIINPIAPFVVEYVVAAAGAGGGGAGGGGGGAGEVQTGSMVFTHTATYNIQVGAGGAGGTQATGAGQNGETSSIFLSGLEVVSALGGGSGSGYAKDTATFYNNGGDGGSGGGSRGNSTRRGEAIGTGFGNDGGLDNASPSSAPGGGGGALTTGSDGYSIFDGTRYDGYAGNGGEPIVISWNPYNSGELGAGGGGGQNATSNPAGQENRAGDGGGTTGGDGGVISSDPQPVRSAGNGATNSGAGGGGGGFSGNFPYNVQDGGNGGSGLVLIRYLGNPIATGGIITQSGGYTIHSFTASGDFTVPNPYI